MPEVERVGYIPGMIGRITEMHGVYYDEYWHMGVGFEARVAEGLAEFLCRYDPSHDGLWIVRDQEQIVGAIAIDGAQASAGGARLRWFILLPAYQGMGLGKRLFTAALDFCRDGGFHKVYLTTFAGLDAARHLYEEAGFRLISEEEGTSWGKAVMEQVFELELATSGKSNAES
jgi:GNAT superfamily N-acetyltransferase